MENGVLMSKEDSFKLQIVGRYVSGKIYKDDAARLLKKSERTVSRYAKSFREKGPLSILHGNTGNTYTKTWDDELIKQVIDLKTDQYYDFNTAHFRDILESKHKIDVPYQTLWKWISKEKLVKNPHRRRRKKHVYRTRMPQEGLLLQMDGCHHKFNGKDDWVLISMIDDATSSIPHAEFFGGETTVNCMTVLEKVIESVGVPKAIYTDKAGWSGGGKRTEFSQFQRACDKLGIQLIFANSPEAKGRIERSFRTVQDRLIPELRINKIKTMKEANKYLKEEFLAKYWNVRNTVAPANEESAYSPLDPYIELDKVLCIEETRVVGSDQTIAYGSEKLLLEGSNINLARYEAVIRTDLKGKTRFFVMEKEVAAKPVTELENVFDPTRKRKRLESLDPDLDKELLELFEIFGVEPVHLDYARMWRTIGNLASAVREHLVIGKPLKIKRPKKRAA